MLPVQVRSVSSSRCSLSEASALLRRFLSSDTCSDSLAREYVANVARALQDAIFRMCKGPESSGKHNAHLSSSPLTESTPRFGNKLVDVRSGIHAKEPVPPRRGDADTDRERRSPYAEDAEEPLTVGLLASENRDERDLRGTCDSEYTALKHHDKKRRKGEERTTEMESELYGSDDQSHHLKKSNKVVETDHLAPDNQSLDGQKRKKRKKHGKGMEEMKNFHVSENKGLPTHLSLAERDVDVSFMNENNVKMSAVPMSCTMEELVGSPKKNKKEGKMFPMATQFWEKGGEKTNREISHEEFENLDFDVKKKPKKKKRRKDSGE